MAYTEQDRRDDLRWEAIEEAMREDAEARAEEDAEAIEQERADEREWMLAVRGW